MNRCSSWKTGGVERENLRSGGGGTVGPCPGEVPPRRLQPGPRPAPPRPPPAVASTGRAPAPRCCRRSPGPPRARRGGGAAAGAATRPRQGRNPPPAPRDAALGTGDTGAAKWAGVRVPEQPWGGTGAAPRLRHRECSGSGVPGQSWEWGFGHRGWGSGSGHRGCPGGWGPGTRGGGPVPGESTAARAPGLPLGVGCGSGKRG